MELDSRASIVPSHVGLGELARATMDDERHRYFKQQKLKMNHFQLIVWLLCVFIFILR
jgi:hypothetical protein